MRRWVPGSRLGSRAREMEVKWDVRNVGDESKVCWEQCGVEGGENSTGSGAISVKRQKARQVERGMESEVALRLARPCGKQEQGIPSFSSLRASLLPTHFIFLFWLAQASCGTLFGR